MQVEEVQWIEGAIMEQMATHKPHNKDMAMRQIQAATELLHKIWAEFLES